MTVTREQVREEMNASSAAVTDAKIDSELAVAYLQVGQYIKSTEVPIEVRDKAVLLVTVESINQTLAPNGVLNQTYDSGLGEVGSTAIRIGRDPLKPAYPVLDPWLSGRFFCA